MKAYIAGPMRGIPKFNFPAFDRLAAHLRGRGWVVASPAEHDREVLGGEALESAPGFAEGDIGAWTEATGFDFAAAMRWDLQQVLEADAIFLLQGWTYSTGAKYERMVAEATGKQVWLTYDFRGLTQGPDFWGLTRDPIQRRLQVVIDGPLAA